MMSQEEYDAMAVEYEHMYAKKKRISPDRPKQIEFDLYVRRPENPWEMSTTSGDVQIWESIEKKKKIKGF